MKAYETATTHNSRFRLMDEMQYLIEENNSLMMEIKALREFYPFYDEASQLFKREDAYND